MGRRQKYFARAIVGEVIRQDDLAIFSSAKHWLDRYFAGEVVAGSELAIKPLGTSFQHEVWQLLCEIPYGQTRTYGELAADIAAKRGLLRMSSQAIGGGVGYNPISIIIPCYRVVGTNGSLTGYASGLDRKIRLLKLEGVDLSPFHRPTKGTAL